MDEFKFADRYAQAGLAPSGPLIVAREESARRIVSTIIDSNILDLVAAYYGSTDVDLAWFRDEFAKEDPSFSLVNNEREARVLAAAILGNLIDDENPKAILSVIAGNIAGHRPPSEAQWLLPSAKTAFGQLAVIDRKPKDVNTKVTSSFTSKLTEEVSSLPGNDWAALLVILGKIRAESQNSNKTISTQSTNALSEINRQMQIMREESQILWWLFGGHSRSLERSFSAISLPQAAIVGAVDLGCLTTFSELGPIAATAVLERVLSSAKKAKGQTLCELAAAVDGLPVEDAARLEVFAELPPRLAPVTAAIHLSRTMGPGNWHARFQENTGLSASIQFDPLALSEQLYREHLLGQLL